MLRFVHKPLMSLICSSLSTFFHALALHSLPMSAALPKYPDPAWLTKCTMCQGFRSVLILCKGTNDKKNGTNNKDRWYEIVRSASVPLPCSKTKF